MGEVIVVTSGKGGVGKTTTAANIGTGLAAQGKKVVLMDTDIGLRNLDRVVAAVLTGNAKDQPPRQGAAQIGLHALEMCFELSHYSTTFCGISVALR